jgi:hypothetical protein
LTEISHIPSFTHPGITVELWSPSKYGFVNRFPVGVPEVAGTEVDVTVGFGLGLETAVVVELGLTSVVTEDEKDAVAEEGGKSVGLGPFAVLLMEEVCKASAVADPSGASRTPVNTAAMATQAVKISPIASRKTVRGVPLKRMRLLRRGFLRWDNLDSIDRHSPGWPVAALRTNRGPLNLVSARVYRKNRRRAR